MYKRIFVFLVVFLSGILLGFSVARGKFATDLHMNRVASFVKEENDPALTAFFNQMSELKKVSITPFFGIYSSENNDIYSLVSLKDKCVIVSELYENDPYLGEVITRTYVFEESNNHIMCAFTRDRVTKQLKRCYYSFNGDTVYVDTNGDGIWDIVPKCKTKECPCPPTFRPSENEDLEAESEEDR
jgi:hypothetical protein